MKRIILVSTILILFAVPSFAVLEDYGDGTVGQLRSDGSKLMWVQDANLSATSGYCATAGNCLDSYGMVTWDQANNWISYLNSITYAGYSDWRLPVALPVNGSSYDGSWSYDGSTDRGWNITSLNSEMAYLFYVELGNMGEYDTSGNYQTGFSSGNSMGPFTNITNFHDPSAAITDGWYWTSSDALNMDNYKKIGFNFGLGRQYGGYFPGYGDHAWAVRDCPSCTVGPLVPEPVSSTLFIIGSAVLGVRRFIRKK